MRRSQPSGKTSQAEGGGWVLNPGYANGIASIHDIDVRWHPLYARPCAGAWTALFIAVNRGQVHGHPGVHRQGPAQT